MGDVCELVKRGIAPRYTESGGVRVINQKCIRDHFVNFDLARRHNLTAKPVSQERYIKKGDVLVNSTGTGTLGRIAQVRSQLDDPTTVDTHVTIVRPKADKFYPDFFGYMMMIIEDEIINSGEGASGQTELPRTKLEQHFSVSFPVSKEEQKRIVAILDEAFAGIATAVANTERNLANARELFESYLNTVFSQRGWEVVGVNEVCESITDCVNKTAPTMDVVTSYKMIRTTNVRHGRIDLASVKYVSEETFRIWTRRQVPQRGDVILTREAPLGEVGMLDTDDFIFLGQRLVSYRADPARLNGRFLLYAFQSLFVQNQIRSLASGSTVQHMRVPDSKRLRLPLPNMAEQQSAVTELDFLREEVKKVESIYQQKLTALAELKQSLLQKAFSGELTADRPAASHFLKEEEVA